MDGKDSPMHAQCAIEYSRKTVCSDNALKRIFFDIVTKRGIRI